MSSLSNLKLAFKSMYSHVESGGTVASFKATLTSNQRQTLRFDLETVAANHSLLVPIVIFLDSGASVNVECWKDGDNLCRLVSGKWLKYGPGVGGIDANGDDVVCTPGVGVPWPWSARSIDWADRVQNFIEANSELDVLSQIKDMVGKLLKEEVVE